MITIGEGGDYSDYTLHEADMEDNKEQNIECDFIGIQNAPGQNCPDDLNCKKDIQMKWWKRNFKIKKIYIFILYTKSLIKDLLLKRR